MTDPAAIVGTIDAYIAAMTDGDREGWLDLFADGATVEDPVGSDPHTGREAIGAFWDLVQGMADELRLERTGAVRAASGEAAWPMQAFSRLGADWYVVDIIDVVTYDASHRITGLRAFWDPAEMRPAPD